MTALEHRRVVPLSAWLTDGIRITTFPAPGVTVNPETWWRTVVGSDPESRTSKPAIRELLEQGPFASGMLHLVVNPLGVSQWHLQPAAPTELPQGIISAGPLEERAAEFLDLVKRWSPLSPPANRVACGVIALLPVSSHEEGYERLASLLSTVKIDPGGSFDFNYKINRPRLSTVLPQVKLNRLAAWSLLKYRVFAAPPGVEGQASFVNEFYACRTELDINIAPEFHGTVPSDRIFDLYMELWSLAVEILEGGDV